MQEFTTEEKLNERIKELSCLYNVSSALLNGNSIDETLSRVGYILKDAWLHSPNAVVELSLGNHSFRTGPQFPKSVSQEIDIYVFNEVGGHIKVGYDATKFTQNDFLDDEQRLLTIVAAEFGSFYEKHLNNEKIKILKRSAERTDRLSILGKITAGIAHELNTPLGNILGFAELIQQRSTDPQSREDSAKVVKAAIYSREIVKKLMFFSCEIPQHIEFIEIGPIVNETMRMLEPNFRKADVASVVTVSDESLRAQVDNIQFTQVLFNILINSIYFAPRKSAITVNVTNDDNWLYIDIMDEGPGISDQQKEKVFEPFFTTKPFGDGTGLGLSVVHGIIKSHKGHITVVNNHPTGTIFKIQLPIKH